MKISISVEQFFQQKIIPSENQPIMHGLMRHVKRQAFLYLQQRSVPQKQIFFK